MGNPGEERLQAERCVNELENIAKMLDMAATEHSVHMVSANVPEMIINILNKLSNLSSRKSAERLLAVGVLSWNSAITLDKFISEPYRSNPNSHRIVILKISHVAADSIMMASAVLGYVSGKFNINELKLLQLYKYCGKMYVEVSDMEMAEVCFVKAGEFKDAALKNAKRSINEIESITSIVFDLLVAHATCAWHQEDLTEVKLLLNEASEYVSKASQTTKFLSSIQYNFGLRLYKAKRVEEAMEFFTMAIKTQSMFSELNLSLERQAKTADSIFSVDSIKAANAFLTCVLNLPAESLIGCLKSLIPGFYGSFLVCFVDFFTRDNATQDENELLEVSPEALLLILPALEAGLRGTRDLGVEKAFGEAGSQREKAIKFLSDVCWNFGLKAKKNSMRDVSVYFFDLCYGYNMLRSENEESKVDSLLLASISVLRSNMKYWKMHNTAKKRLEDASSLLKSNPDKQELRKSVVFLLRAMCCIEMGDDVALSCFVQEVRQQANVDMQFLQSVADICVNYTGNHSFESSERIAQRNELASLLLKNAVDLGLSNRDEKLNDLILVQRRLILSETSRGELSNRSMQAFSIAISLIKNNALIYPSEEKRWLAAFAWDRAEMFNRLNRFIEAKLWAQSAVDVASSDSPLSIYIPRIVKLSHSELASWHT